MISLADCANYLQHAPNCLAFVAAWQQWRGTELVPRLEDVRPEILGQAINGLSVVELLSPDDAVYRLVGKLHTEVMGRELAGTHISEVTKPDEQKPRMQRLWNIANTPCGMYVQSTVVRDTGVADPLCRIIFPVRPAGPSDPMRLYGAMDRYGHSGSLNEQPVELISVSHEVQYIDIGCGVPD